MDTSDKSAKKKVYNDRHRAKNTDKIRKQEKERRQLQRDKLKLNEAAHDEQKRKDRERKRLSKATKESTSLFASTNSTPGPAFKYNATKARSVAKAVRALPATPRRRSEVVATLAKKLHLEKIPRKKPGPPKIELNEEQEKWLVCIYICFHSIHKCLILTINVYHISMNKRLGRLLTQKPPRVAVIRGEVNYY